MANDMMNKMMNIDLNNSKTITILIIVVLILFALVYISMIRSEEGFADYTVSTNDLVKLQGGLNNVQVGSNNTPLQEIINQLIQNNIATEISRLQNQITSVSSSIPSSSQLICKLTYQITPTSTYGNRTIDGSSAVTSNKKNIVYDNDTPNNTILFPWELPSYFTSKFSTTPTSIYTAPVNSVINLFDWKKPNNILNPISENSLSVNPAEKNKNIIINYAYPPGNRTIYDGTLITNLQLNNNSNYKVDLSASWMALGNFYGVGDFSFQLVQFLNNSQIKCTLLDFLRLNGSNHTQRTISFIVPATPNMINWAIYLIAPNDAEFVSNIKMDLGDSVSITITKL